MDRTREELCARTGDMLVVHARRVGERERFGEILEILGDAGHEHFRVRWDEGHESVFYPGADATVRPTVRKTESRGRKRT